MNDKRINLDWGTIIEDFEAEEAAAEWADREAARLAREEEERASRPAS